MSDRVKVIKGLECCITDGRVSCEKCYQEGPGFGIECRQGLMRDALELLKTQEPVEPILALNDGEHKLWQCGNCKVAVFTRDTTYCHNCGKAVKWGMQCKDIEFGTGDCAYNIHLPWLVDGKAKMVNIDKCLLPEIIHLWELGIKTTGCCCGHGKTDMQEPFIGVEFEYIDKMLELGYKVCPNKYRPRDRDSFYPMTILKYGNADKGFNWWDSQEGCEVKW